MAAGCATSDVPSRSRRRRPSGLDVTVTPAVDLTRGEIVAALGAQNLVLADSQAAVRPAEAPLLGAAPRAVYQVLLPKDPTRGFIVVYEFADPGRAAAAAAEQQAYLGTGPGRVQTPAGDRDGHPPGRLDGHPLRVAAGRLAGSRRRPASRPPSRRSGRATPSRN